MGKRPRKGYDATKNELWMAVQMAEEIAHGGRPSGIDAMSVVSGSTKLTRVLKDEEISWRFEKKLISLPKGTSLIIVDTFKGKRSTTGEMIKIFAKRYGLLQKGAVKTLHDLTAADKTKLAAFQKVFAKIVVQLKPNGSPVALGKALERNQALLSKGGVSTKRIDYAVRIAKEHGAHGAKLTGAGGHGGAVIVVADKSRVKSLKEAYANKGFGTFPVKPTKRGTRLTFKGRLKRHHRK
jgi:mevalonate kinase